MRSIDTTRPNRYEYNLNYQYSVDLTKTRYTGATQSFIHALISDAIRQYDDSALDLIAFKNCSPIVKEVITTVTEYMQES